MSKFKEESSFKIRIKINNILKLLPDFCTTYTIGRERRLSNLSLLSYLYKLKIFFEYLHDFHPLFKNIEITEFTLSLLSKLNSEDFEMFLHYLTNREDSLHLDSTIENYTACLSSFWVYFCKKGIFKDNPILLLDRAKKKKKEIIRLKGNEKKKFLDTVEFGSGLTERQQIFHEKNQTRDTAICYLFLDTGLRISELVGIDINDINFNEHCISILRKGDKYQEIFFSDITETYLKECILNREIFHPEEDEKALFLSKYGKRIGIRSVEKLVKKYATTALPEKMEHITPHKLRSTCASDTLKACGNLEIVGKMLGHESISTTLIYAETDLNDRKKIRNLDK